MSGEYKETALAGGQRTASDKLHSEVDGPEHVLQAIDDLIKQRDSLESELDEAYESQSPQKLIDVLETRIEAINLELEKLEEEIKESEPVELEMGGWEEVYGVRDFDENELVYELFNTVHERRWREREGTLTHQNPRLETREEYADWIRALFAEYNYEKVDLTDDEWISFAEGVYEDELAKLKRRRKMSE